MAKSVENEDKGDSFDLDRIRKLLQLMEKFDVSEINLQNDDESWKIRRGPRVAFAPPGPASAYAMPMTSQTAAPAVAATSLSLSPRRRLRHRQELRSMDRLWERFYSAASPDDAPFVTVGSVVKPDTVICMIEAMKVFNQILAEKSGRIVEILWKMATLLVSGSRCFASSQCSSSLLIGH